MAFFSRCVTESVSVFLQLREKQPPQHRAISNLSQFVLLFTRKSPYVKELVQLSFFTHLLSPHFILNTNDFLFCVTQG